jgi:predicted TIM-barrel fold metal-dependent hydrolase
VNSAAFRNLPVIDGHIHLAHPYRLPDILRAMELTGASRANLVAVPDLRYGNQNPALIYAKAQQPGSVWICGALDYSAALANLGQAAGILGRQIANLKAMGLDGLKLIEGKPMVRRLVPVPLDSPVYAGVWEALEEAGFPVVFHVADPEEFWDTAHAPDWAVSAGWSYAGGDYPLKEALYAEVDHVLARHPGLKISFAHFYFLSADLPRAGAFLDAHPSVCLDLTPGVEMYFNFSQDVEVSRAFFLRYQDRLIYGSDIGAGLIQAEPSQALDMAESTGRAWAVRQFLETDEVFGPPPEMGHWNRPDEAKFRGIALPDDVLAKIYGGNFRRLFGATPAALARDAALAELERLAAVADAQAGGQADSPARWVRQRLLAPAQAGQ